MAYRPAREGRRVAYHTLVSCVFLVIVLALVLSGWTKHGGERSKDGSGGRARSEISNLGLPPSRGGPQ
jgi:hypothetical protein